MENVEKRNRYVQIIKGILQAHVNEGGIHNPDYECYMIADDTNFNYLVCQNMWRDGTSRVYGCYLHLRIKNEKVYVEYNGTDIEIAEVLVEAGIPKNDIVLAFHSPAKRIYTGYATA